MSDDEYDPEDIKHLFPLPERRPRRLCPEYVTCEKCGWVSFAVSQEEANAWIRETNTAIDMLPEDKKESHGGRVSLADYTCLRCGGSEFRPAKDGDCPDGCTINPVVHDRYAGILNRFAANAAKLVADIWKEISAKGHGSLVSPYDFDHLIDEELSSLHIRAIFDRLEREARLYKLDGLEYWAVSLDGMAPDAQVVAAMVARRKEAGLGSVEQTDDGFRYRWTSDGMMTGIDGVSLEFVYDVTVAKGSVN